MRTNYDWLVPQTMAPLYWFDGRPLIKEGQQVCLPFSVAAAHNWDVIKDQGTVVQVNGAGEPLSAEDIKRDIRTRITSSLLGNASSADLYFFNPIELLIVSKDEDLLWVQRSHRGASEGMINHFAGGFPKVVENKHGFLHAEPKQITATRETRQELGVQVSNVVDLNCATYNSTITAFALKTKDGGTYPGFVPEIVQRFGYRWDASTAEIISKLKTGSDSSGMVITRLPALEAMLRGEQNVAHQFMPNSIPSMQRFIEGAMAGDKINLSAVRQALLESAPMTDVERREAGVFDLSRIMPAVSGPDVFYAANYASGLAAFKAAGVPLSNYASQHLETFRFESRRQMLVPPRLAARPDRTLQVQYEL